MKRYIKFLLVAIIAIVIPFSVLAEKTNIKNTVITDIKIPDKWQLITKANINEMTKWLGYDTKRANEYKYEWLNNNYYAAIVNEEKNKEIIIIKEIRDFPFDDLSIYPDEKIIESFSKLENDYRKYKPTITLYTTAQGLKYYKVKYNNINEKLKDEENSKEEPLYYIEYLTSIHGNVYKFKYKNNLEISKEDLSTIESIIKTVEYDEYLSFVKNNKVEIEEKKDNSASSIIVIFIMLIIVIAAVIFYIKFFKKKDKTTTNTVTQVYNPVQKDNPTNPAIVDFIENKDSTDEEKSQDKENK